MSRPFLIAGRTALLLAFAVLVMSSGAVAQQPWLKEQFKQKGGPGGPGNKGGPSSEEIARKKAAARTAILEEKNRGVELFNAGRYAEAEAVLKGGLQRTTAELGASHRGTTPFHANLARLYNRLGRLKEAEHHARRTVDLLAGETDLDGVGGRAGTRAILATILMKQDRCAEAESQLKQAIATFSGIADRWHAPYGRGMTHATLGLLYHRQGRLAEAESALVNAVSIQEKKMGSDNIWTARVVRFLGAVVAARGRPDEAETHMKRVIAVMERTTGRDRSELADSLVDLADFYVGQGRLGEVEPIYKRAIAAYEAAHGPAHALTASAMLGLGRFYDQTGNLAAAEPLLRKTLTLYERTRGADTADTAEAVSALGNVLAALDRRDEALPLLKRALTIRERALGREHVLTAESLASLGASSLAAGRHDEAEAELSQALALTEKAIGVDHPRSAEILLRIGELELARGRTEVALAVLQRASAILSARREATAGVLTKGPASDVNPRIWRAVHATLAAASWQHDDDGRRQDPALLERALLAAQHGLSTAAGSAVGQMSARLAAGNDGLADLLRRGQDLANHRQDLDRELTAGLGGDFSEEGRSTPTDRAVLRKEIARLATEIGEISRQLQKQFPEYAALARADPLTAGEIKELVGPDEALIAYLVQDKATYVFAVTRAGARWQRAELGAAALARDVEALRCGLEADAWIDPGRHARCKELGLTHSSADVLPYDLGVAHRLYKTLIAPFAAEIAGKQLIVVPSGALTSLSFHALVTAAPGRNLPDPAGYRAAPWLARQHAITVLPSIPSLKALRQTARATAAPKVLIGYAAPEFQSGGGQRVAAAATGTAKRALSSPTRSVAAFYSGGRANLEALRQGLAPLPETEDELKAVARSVGAGTSDLIVGRAATEAEIKKTRLADYRIVYFATHGLIAGEVEGLSEPALALTLPGRASEVDDGLLTASEVARLKLNADWVVLSACNTAAGSKPGAEALSGLARAFFYAGTRALLVSHWRVNSEAAVKLTTGTFAALAERTDLPRAEALRGAMLKVIEAGDDESPQPSYWAPFAVVGGGQG